MTPLAAPPPPTGIRASTRAAGLVLVLLAAGACRPAPDPPTTEAPAAPGGGDASRPRAGRILPDGTVLADTFEVRYQRRGDTLTVVLETDLPDATLLDVHLSRTYRRSGSAEELPLDYFYVQSTVGAWRRPHAIRIDDAAWRAELESVASAGEPFEVRSIGRDVELSLTVPIHQAEPFREGNENLRGSAVSLSTWGWIVRREIRIPDPAEAEPLPPGRGGAPP
jgi:hypothetical protein